MQIFFAETMPAHSIQHANCLTANLIMRQPWKPTLAWAMRQVQAEHSTLDMASLIIVDDVRADVISHMVRHTAYHPRHFVQSSRPDWTGKPRSKDSAELKPYMSRWPIKALLAMSRQRLCTKAMAETRQWVEGIKKYLSESTDVLMQAMGEGMMPICEYRRGCPYGQKGCGKHKSS